MLNTGLLVRDGSQVQVALPGDIKDGDNSCISVNFIVNLLDCSGASVLREPRDRAFVCLLNIPE